MEPTEPNIGLLVDTGLEKSPHGDIGTCLIKEATVTLFWAAGQRRVADAGDDSDGIRASMLTAEVVDLRMRMKRGSLNLQDVRLPPQQKSQRKRVQLRRTRFINIRRPSLLQNQICLEHQTQHFPPTPKNVICPDPSPGMMMKTLHHSSRTWIWRTMFRVQLVT